MGDRIRAVLKRLGGEHGQGLAEYSLIIAFVAAVSVVAVTALGVAIAGGLGAVVPSF